jgi:hypothetical protein
LRLSLVLAGTINERESKVISIVSARPLVSISKAVLSGITIGLTVRLWAAIGVITNDLLPGKISGPPQLSEYPEDPVGVATISPSDQ